MKSFLKTSGVVLGALLLSYAVGFIRHALESRDKDDQFIPRTGVYRVNGGQWSLVVEMDRYRRITYQLTDEHGKTLYEEKKNVFLGWQFWAMYWEKDAKRLWLLSSDIGDYVCLPDARGEYARIAINAENAPRIKTAPKAVIEIEPEYLEPLFGKR